MKEQLEKIRSEALAALNEAKDSAELDALRVRFLGKKGELTAVLKMMGKLSAEERPVMGQAANNVRAAIEEKLEETKTALKARALDARLEEAASDYEKYSALYAEKEAQEQKLTELMERWEALAAEAGE